MNLKYINVWISNCEMWLGVNSEWWRRGAFVASIFVAYTHTYANSNFGCVHVWIWIMCIRMNLNGVNVHISNVTRYQRWWRRGTFVVSMYVAYMPMNLHYVLTYAWIWIANTRIHSNCLNVHLRSVTRYQWWVMAKIHLYHRHYFSGHQQMSALPPPPATTVLQQYRMCLLPLP